MDRSTPPTVLAAGLLVTSALVTGCQDDELGSRGDYSVQDALGEVPASLEDENVIVFTGDLAQASELAGLERPSDPESDATGDWVIDLSGGSDDDHTGVFVPLPDMLTHGSPVQVADRADSGWSIVDVDSFVATNTFVVASGDFEEDTLNDELTEVEEGIVTDEGEDPLRYAAVDGRVAAAAETEALRAWLDDEESSLTDDDAYAEVARALDDQDAYSAVILPMVGSDEYDLVGIGWSEDDDGPLVSTAFHFDSEDAARDSVDEMRERFDLEPIGDQIEVEDADTEGSSVVVTARPEEDSIDILMRAVVSLSPPFYSD